MKRKILLIAVLVSILCLGAIVSAQTIPEASGTSLKDTVEFLSNLGSRVPGYEGNIKAADYIHEVFNELKLEDIKREEFPVTIPVDKGAGLKGPRVEEIELYCL